MTMTGLNGTTYRLGSSKIGSGGEGDIYSVAGMDCVAKIYKPFQSIWSVNKILKPIYSFFSCHIAGFLKQRTEAHFHIFKQLDIKNPLPEHCFTHGGRGECIKESCSLP